MKKIFFVICIISFCIFAISFSDFNGRIADFGLSSIYVKTISFLFFIIFGGFLQIMRVSDDEVLK